MGLEQSSSTSPHRVELLGAPHGGNGVLELTLPQLTRKLNQTTIILLRRKVRTLTGDEHPAFRAFHPDIEIAQMKGFGLTFAGQVDMDYPGDQRRILVDSNIPGFAIRRVHLEFSR